MSIPRHHSIESLPGDRGLRFGRDQRDAVQHTVRSYRKLFQARVGINESDVLGFGDEVGNVLSARWPDLVEEIAGIAAGSGNDHRELLAVNARAELIARGVSATASTSPPPECSLVAFAPTGSSSGAYLIGQNWDYHPDFAPSRVLWSVDQGAGKWFVTMTEAGILAKIGLNSRHVGLGVNVLASGSDGHQVGVPIHVLARIVLSESSNLTDALRVLLAARVSASFCLTVGYCQEGRGVAVATELSPEGTATVFPDGDGRLVHTNHFLGGRVSTDIGRVGWPGSLVRRWDLMDRSVAASESDGISATQDMLSSHFNFPDAVCSHCGDPEREPDRYATLASIIMDLEALELWIADGPPCETPYERIPLSQKTAPTRQHMEAPDFERRAWNVGEASRRQVSRP